MRQLGKSGVCTVLALVAAVAAALVIGTAVDVIDGRIKFPDSTGKHVYQLRVGNGNSMDPVLQTGDTLYMIWDWNEIEEGYVIAGNGLIHRVEQVKRDGDGNPVWVRCRGINNWHFDTVAVRKETYRGTLARVEK